MNRLLLAIALVTQAAPPQPRPLPSGGDVRGTLAGGGRDVFSFDVPAGTAARVVVRQEGVDVGLTVRRAGSELPVHGLDFVSGPGGEEIAYPAILDTPAAWTVTVAASLPRAARGGYAIRLELAPADDRARTVAAAWAKYSQAWQDARVGDGAGYTRARAAYTAAAAEADAAGEQALAAEAMFQCALTIELQGDMPASIDWHRRALDAFRRLGRRDREARVLNRLGDQSRKVGEVEDSRRYFDEALPLARANQDPSGIVDVLNNSALLRSTLGHFEEAIEQFTIAIPLAREAGATVTELALTANLAESYSMLGQHEQSIATYQQALEVARRVNLPRRTALTQRMLAEAYIDAGEPAKAEPVLRASMPLWQQSGDHTGQAVAEAILGRVLREAGDGDAAVAIFARALPVLRGVNARGGTANTLREWATVDIDRGRIDAALEKLDEALAIERAIAQPDNEAQTLYLRARALRTRGDAGAALSDATRSVEITEKMRSAMQRNEHRAAYVASVRRYFDLTIDLLMQQGNAASAFEMSERGRARTLLEGLAESAARIHKGVDPALLARERAVQERLNAKESYRARVVLAEGEKSPRAVSLGQDVARLLDEWNGLRASILASSPSYWALQQPQPLGAARVQRTILDAGTSLVEYHLGQDRSYVWVIDRDAITAHELPPETTLDPLARRYHTLLSRDSGALDAAARLQTRSETSALGRRLAAAIWKPIEARVAGRRVVIVADGALQYVPFAALPAASGDPLIARHEIVYLPSASVLDTLRRDSRPIGGSVTAAVFADPVFSKNDTRFGAARDAAAPASTRAADGGLYGRLRFSRAEADAIAAAAPGSFTAVDFDASKSTVTARDLRKYRILHFATHGSLNTAQPELSGLVFSLLDRAGAPVDGFLRLHEIYNLDLDADLVVLSACRTALGKEVHGEGLIGLTRGFMFAGATRVVSSVWNVDDRASAQLMTRFYAAMLAKKMSPAAALRDAQLSMLREPRWADPHTWAAFGLQGEWK